MKTVAPIRPYPVQREIKAAMQMKDLRLQELADKTGHSYGYLARLLSGYAHSRPALAKARRVLGLKQEGMK